MPYANKSVRTITGTAEVHIADMPDKCPICHYVMIPEYLGGFLDKDILFLNFNCVRNECYHYFVIECYADFRNTFHVKRALNGCPNPMNFSDIIQEISPDFINILGQADTAQQEGLDQVCGMGFRKAFEFLIKDYIIYKNAPLKTVVEKKPLGACINDHISSEPIKDIAKRATWLGNDETHYVRIWKTHDVNSLISLIKLAVHWIETEYLTEKIIRDMDPGQQ